MLEAISLPEGSSSEVDDMMKQMDMKEFPWKRIELPTYSRVRSFLERNPHSLFSISHRCSIFQIWNVEYIKSLASSISIILTGDLVLEVCAGDGALTRWLSKYGVNIRATDDLSWGKNNPTPSKAACVVNPIFPVEELDAIEAIRKYSPRMVITSWIPYGSDLDIRILREKPEFLIIIGEGEGGCTGSSDFWKEYPSLGYKRVEDFLSCDAFSICRTDSFFGGEHIIRHGWVELFARSDSPFQL